MKLLLVDALSAGQGSRKSSRDVIGAGPRTIAGVVEEFGGGWNVLKTVSRTDRAYKLYACKPEETTRDLAVKMYGEKAEELL